MKFSHLDYVCKVFSLNVIISLDEDLPKDGFSNRVVFGVELVKSMECVAVLRRKRNQVEHIFISPSYTIFFCTEPPKY